MSANGTEDEVLARLLAAAETTGIVDWAVEVFHDRPCSSTSLSAQGLGRITRIRASSR
jgi:hypothetical protein